MPRGGTYMLRHGDGDLALPLLCRCFGAARDCGRAFSDDNRKHDKLESAPDKTAGARRS